MNCPNCKQNFSYNVEKPIVALCVPALDSVIHYSIMAQWNHLLQNYRAFFLVKDNTYIDMARNHMVLQGKQISQKVYGKNPDYFLFVDADTVIGKRSGNGDGNLALTPELVDAMIARGKPVVSGWYVKKRDSVAQIPVFGHGDPTRFSTWVEPEDRLLEIDWCGAGYLLVEGRVFEEVPEPWFQNRNDPFGDGYIQVGEDIYFCKKVKEHGIPIYLDLNVKVGHFGSIAWPPEE